MNDLGVLARDRPPESCWRLASPSRPQRLTGFWSEGGLEDSAFARAAQLIMLTVLRTAAAPTSASSSHLGHVEHGDQVSGRTRSGKGWCYGAVRRTNDLVFHLRERERNGHAHTSPPPVHTWMPFTRVRLPIPVAIVSSAMNVCLRSSSPSSSPSSSFCGCVCVCLLARLLHRLAPPCYSPPFPRSLSFSSRLAQ